MRTTRKFDNSCPFFIYKIAFPKNDKGDLDGEFSRMVSRASVEYRFSCFCIRGRRIFHDCNTLLQIRYFKEMIKLLFEGKSSETGISSFQAFCLALSGRVGIGNIAGVATAIAFGGPGAVFWMWVMAVRGSEARL